MSIVIISTKLTLDIVAQGGKPPFQLETATSTKLTTERNFVV